MACPVLLVVALTGALYTFREEIEDFQQADVRFVEPVGNRKPLSEQIAAVNAAHPDRCRAEGSHGRARPLFPSPPSS